jgi:drug/metabolite transporter (DMT)-like permease
LQLKGYLYIIAAAGLWGILGPFSRLAFSQGLAPMEVASWRAVLARFAFRQLFTPAKVLALGLTLIGVVCVAWGGGTVQVTWASLIFGLTAGFCYSFYYIFRKYFSTRYTSPNLFFYRTIKPFSHPQQVSIGLAQKI